MVTLFLLLSCLSRSQYFRKVDTVVAYKKENSCSSTPSMGTPGSAGYDLSSTEEEATLHPGKVKVLDTGISLEIPANHFGLVKERSSLAMQGLVCLGGVIDSDYRGTIKIILANFGEIPFFINPKKKIAQLIFVHISTVRFAEVPTLNTTNRKSGGFGSTNPVNITA